jgi:hypothetical protein
MKRNLVILLTVLVFGTIAACKPGQKNNSDMENQKETMLKIETTLGDIKVKLYNETSKHTVGLQPESDLHVLPRNGQIIIGNIVIRPGIILTTGQLEGSIVIGNIHGSSKHQMLKKMGKSRMIGMLVPSPYIIYYIESHHLRTVILRMHQSQTIGQNMPANL